MTLEIYQLTEDKRDYYGECVAYLNARFCGEDDMESRIGFHLCEYAASVGARLEEPTPGQFCIVARGAVIPKNKRGEQ